MSTVYAESSAVLRWLLVLSVDLRIRDNAQALGLQVTPAAI